MIEIWKDIKGYEMLYQISNLGKIKATNTRVCGKILNKERMLKPTIAKNGYYRVSLSKDKKTKYYNLHRLLAETFIPNPNNYPVVNHIDGNKQNNKLDNLEWCTQRHNVKESFNLGLSKIPKDKYNHKAKKIMQKDMNGNLIKVWDYMMQIQNNMGFDYTCISKCCNGHIKTSYGYKWEFYKNKRGDILCQ